MSRHLSWDNGTDNIIRESRRSAVCPDAEEVTPLRYIEDVRLSETPYKHEVRHTVTG